MATRDGDITLSVNIEAGDVKTAANKLVGQLEDIFAKAESQNGLSDAFKSAQTSAAKLYDSIAKVYDEMVNLENVNFETDEFAKTSEQLDALKIKFADIQDKLNIFKLPSGNYKNVPEVQALLKQLQDVKREIDAVTAKRQQMMQDGTAFYKGSETVRYVELTQTLNDLTNRATIVTDKLNEMARATPPTTAFSGLANVMQTVASGAKSASSSIAKLVGTAIKSKIASLTKAMKGLSRSTRGQNNALQVGFKNFIRYGLGVRSIFALINKLRRALFEGIGNLAQYSPNFNAVVSDFISALATLKNAFAAAFSPILSVALPALTALMNALLDAIAVIGSFFSALTGQTTFIKAKRLNKDYAASLSKTGSSAGDAAGGISDANDAAKELKRTIAGFDDVEILHEDKSSGSSGSGGSGGGGGAGGLGDISPADMFETLDIESPIAEFARKIRELIGSQDWEGLGQFLGENINSIFEKAKELISWDNLGARITFVIDAIATTFNSLVDTVDWELIGSTFAEGINTLIKTLDLFVRRIDWGLLGTSVSEGLNGLFTNVNWEEIGLLVGDSITAIFGFIDNAITTFKWEDLGTNLASALYKIFTNVSWSKVGKTFADGVNGVLDLLYGFITTFNWKSASSRLMGALNSFIHNVNWKRLGSVLGELIKALLGTFKVIISEFDWTGFGKSVGEFLSGIDWFGIISAVLSTIVQIGISLIEMTFGTTGGLATALATAFLGLVASIKEYFAGYGGDIVQGLYDGIVAAFDGIAKWIIDNVFDPFIQAFKDAFGIKSPSKVMEEQGGYVIEGLYDGITAKWKTIKSFFSAGVKGITGIFKAENWKGSGSDIVEKVKGGLSSTWSTLTSNVSSKISGVKGQFTRYNWKPGGTSIVSGIKSGIQSLWSSSIIVYFYERIKGIKDQFTTSNWASTGESIVNKLKSGITNKYGEITSKFNSMISDIKSKFNDTDWKSVGKNICSGLESGINAGWSWVTDKARSLASAAKGAAEDELKINSPSKVFRDRIGRAIPEGLAAGIEADSKLAITAVTNLSKAVASQDIPQLQIPSVALGKIIPYEMSKNVDTLNETMKSLVDVLRYNQSNAITREDITNVLNEVLPTMLERYVSFYIGDEQIARHANAGNVRLDYRFNPVGR